MKKFFLSLSLILSIFAVSSAQEFKFLLDEQLTSKLVSDIYQDRDGFIWIATDNGLNRFDGNKVKTYSHNDTDSQSLRHNLIYATYEDKNGILYVGNYLGIQIYDKKRDCFSEGTVYSDGSSFLETVNGFCELPDGTLCSYGDNAWKVSILDGCLVVDSLQWDIPNTALFRVATDKQNNIWALRRDDGLYKIRNGKARLICHYDNPDFRIYDFMIVDGIVYIISSNNDIFCVNTDNEAVRKVNTEPISKSSVRYLIDYDDPQTLMVCTDGNGFKLLNLLTGKVSDFYINIPMLTSNHLKVHKVIRDNNGNLWIALYQRGVAVISAAQNSFGYIGYKSLLNNIIGNSTVSAIAKGRDGNIWVGTDGDGIYKMDKDAVASVHFPSFTDGGTTPPIIKAIHTDSNGDVWFGTYGNSIGMITHDSDRYVSKENIFQRRGNVATRIYDITEDNDKRLWVATLSDGLFCYDLKQKKLIEELSFFNELNKWQTCLLHTSTNNLYVGSFSGLYRIDLNQDTIRPLHIPLRTVINSLYEDSKGQIWAGDNNGLLLFDTSDNVRYFSTGQGLPKVSVNSINEDNNGSLWLATDKGLINYNPNEPSCFRYSTNEGLQNISFSKFHSFKDASGRIWFAGDYGVTYFNPQELELSKNKRHVRVLDFLINNESITTETLSGGKPIISEPAYNAKTFNLSRANNSFIIEFGTYELDTPKFAEYMYSVNGGEWQSIQPGDQRAFFNNLETGEYIIRYKVAENLVESDTQEIRVVVHPYWWASWWAWLIYVLVFILVVAIVGQQLRYRYLAKKRNQQHQRTIEINEAKLQFFTNISHDIKTPLSLIISPLQKLMATDDDPKRQASYNTMYRSSKQLIQLVNQLLDLRKIDNGKLKLKFRETDIIATIEELCKFFDVVSEEKNINFSFMHDAQHLEAWVDTSYFDKIIMNLLSNAFKYTPKGGAIVLSVRTIEKMNGQRFVEIEVKDNGIGIKEGDLDHIFERFYVAENTRENGLSNGIGLHLTRSLVELHHGNISAANNPDGQGARFAVELPLGREHLQGEDVVIEDEKMEQIVHEQENISIDTGNIEVSKSQTTKTLLVVDDDPAIISYMRTELSQDFHIETCDNGKDALQMVFVKQPDIIISDVMMPEMDGITFCKKIKQNVNFNHIPIILLTAKSDETTNLQGLKYGADAYITKPFYIEVLRRTALNLVNLRSQLHNIYSGQQTQDERQVKIEMESPNQKLLDRIMRVVNANIGNPDLSIDMLCSEVGISRAHIYRKLKELTNQSGRDFIRNVRLKYAEKLLLEDKYTIGEIAEKVGFTQASNFTNAFKEKYGLPPNQWRQANQQI